VKRSSSAPQQPAAIRQVTRAALPGKDLERDVASQLSAKNAFLANLAVFRPSNEMSSGLLSLRA